MIAVDMATTICHETDKFPLSGNRLVQCPTHLHPSEHCLPTGFGAHILSPYFSFFLIIVSGRIRKTVIIIAVAN
jgi:hypothetical protein